MTDISRVGANSLPYDRFDVWLGMIRVIRQDMKNVADCAAFDPSYIRDLIYDGAEFAALCTKLELLKNSPSGLGLTVIGCSFIAYVNQFDHEMADWLATIFHVFANSGAWDNPGGDRPRCE